LHFDKLSANGFPINSITYPFVLSLSKHEWIIFRGSFNPTTANDMSQKYRLTKGVLLLATVLTAICFATAFAADEQIAAPVNSPQYQVSDSILANAFAKNLSNVQVEGQGTVIKLLPDDNNGSKHQRFIIRLDSGQTLLVAHNIDIAPKIETLKVDDTLLFFGEYEWNAKGGVIHWTHHDSKGQHANGWIKHAGITYQ
jgi:hypothetical protein